jgi:hypothetical protein
MVPGSGTIDRRLKEDDAMQLLRTAAGGFINAERIVRLADERGEDAGSWMIAVLDDGEEVALAVYYNAPGRVERPVSHDTGTAARDNR